MVVAAVLAQHRNVFGTRVLSLVPVDGPTPASDRGAEIARACGAELIVARFSAPPGGGDGASPGGPLVMTAAAIADTGRLVADLDVAIVVVEAQLAPTAVALAEWLGIPTLVARAPRGEPVLIATGVPSAWHPVVSAGVRFAARLAVPAIAIHNVEAPGRDGELVPLVRIVDFARECGVTRTVVAREPSTPHAILEVARSERADVIVVGTRRRARLSSHPGASIPERVARDASCSVLVAPTVVASA
jgi:nucleotide-binding universal stress UspA family protein